MRPSFQLTVVGLPDKGRAAAATPKTPDGRELHTDGPRRTRRTPIARSPPSCRTPGPPFIPRISLRASVSSARCRSLCLPTSALLYVTSCLCPSVPPHLWFSVSLSVRGSICPYPSVSPLLFYRTSVPPSLCPSVSPYTSLPPSVRPSVVSVPQTPIPSYLRPSVPPFLHPHPVRPFKRLPNSHV